jgi:hypothetical protein
MAKCVSPKGFIRTKRVGYESEHRNHDNLYPRLSLPTEVANKENPWTSDEFYMDFQRGKNKKQVKASEYFNAPKQSNDV